MLAGQTPTQLYTSVENFLAGFHYTRSFICITLIVHQDGMNVAVARVEHIGDAELMLLGHLSNDPQNVRHFRPGHDAVLRTIIRREATDRAKSALAAFP